MKVYLNSISGIDDAFVALTMSKKHWNEGKDKELRDDCLICLDHKGFYIPIEKNISRDFVGYHYVSFNQNMERLTKWGCKHITLLKFIDLSITVEGLHRGGQDDWDSHAKRFNNRIVRNSTRIKGVDYSYEMSDYYKGKIIPTDLLLNQLDIELPEKIELDGKTYVKTINGYILEGYKDNNDVKRGLYMLSIPSNFIFKINLAEWAHVYKQRNGTSGANPEVKECCELIADELYKANPFFTRELFNKIEN